MKSFIFCFLLTLGCCINSVSAQSDSLITVLEKTLQVKIDSLGEEHIDVAMLYVLIATNSSIGKRWHKVIQYSQKAIPILLNHYEEERDTDWILMVAVLRGYLDRANVELGNYEQAVHLEDALKIQQKHMGENHINMANLYNFHGTTQSMVGNYARAIELYSKALNIRLKVFGEKHPDVAYSYNYLGQEYRKMSKCEKAITAHKKALDIRIELYGKKHLSVSQSYNNLGVTLSEKGEYKEAISILHAALDLVIEINKKPDLNIAALYDNLGLNYGYAGDYEQAINFCNIALERRKQLSGEKSNDAAASYNNLGFIYSYIGDYNKAIIFYEKAIDIQCKVLGEKHPDLATSYNNLGGSYTHIGNYKKALTLYNQALDMKAEILGGKHPSVALSYNYLGAVYTAMADFKQAIVFLEKAIGIQNEAYSEKHPNVAISYSSLGYTYAQIGDYKNAIIFHNKALNIRLEVLGEKHPNTVNSHSNLAIGYEQSGKYKKADSLWNIIIPQSLERLKLTCLFLPDDQRLKYSNALLPTIHYFYSFATTHGNKSTKELATNFLINTKSIGLDYAVSTSKFIKEINNTTLTTKYKELNSTNKKLADAEKLINKELKQKKWNISKIREERDNLSFQILQHPQLKSKLNTETIEWQDIQDSLASNEATIDFLRIYEKQDSLWAYYGIVISKELSSPQFVRLTDEETLKQYFVDSLGGENLEDSSDGKPDYLVIEDAKYYLYKHVWQPLEPYLENIKKVHISPSGTLHQLPFESLTYNMAGGYLSKRYDIRYHSALRDMLKAKPQKMTYKDIVLMGHILYDLDNREDYELVSADGEGDRTRSGIKPLPETLEEVRRINKIGKKARLKTTLLTIDAPSEDTVQTFVGERAPSIIHFATHGVFLPSLRKKHQGVGLTSQDRIGAADNPLQRSALMLYGANETWTKGRPILGSGEDGILTALEVTALDLQNTDLVVLSACSTGLGNVHNTEGVFGLQRAFKLAGVDYVVASLWNVNDEATKDLMVRFYKNLLQQKQDPATALRNAKNYFMDKGDDPERWAGFILIE